jgi:hypothetical protein
MNLSESEPIPDDPNRLPPARRRRALRLLAPLDADEQAAFSSELALKISPSFDFFLFSVIAAVIMGVGLLLSAPALLVLGAVLAPAMTPAIGASLGTMLGSFRFFFRSLFGIMLASLFVLLVGYGIGILARPWLPLDFGLASIYTQLNWTNFLLLALGAILTSAAISRSTKGPLLPSVALAYELYLPLVATGIGLGSGAPHLWPDGLVVFTIHLAWATLLGALTLGILGFRPLTWFGYTFGAVVSLIGVILLIGISGAGAAFGGQIALPTAIPSATPTSTLTFTVTPSPIPPTATLTPTLTPTPTLAPTETLTPTPTPVLALVRTRDGLGALIRSEPGGQVIGSFLDNVMIQVLPERFEDNAGVWVRVIGPDGTQGWMLQSLLVTATPAPNW